MSGVFGEVGTDTDTAGSSTTKGGTRVSSQPWHPRVRRWLASAGDKILKAIVTAGTFRIGHRGSCDKQRPRVRNAAEEHDPSNE